jgi:hypothetical protein
MTRHLSSAVLVMLAILLLGLPAVAQEPPKPKPEKPQEPAAAGQPATIRPLESDLSEELTIAPVTGEKVEIQVRPGVVLKGVVKDHRCEVLTPEGRYAQVESDEVPGAGVRVWHAMGLDGFIFIRYDSLKEIAFHGKLSQEEGMALARRIHEEMRRAAEEKRVAIAEMATRREEAKARKAAGKVEAEEAVVEEEILGEGRRAVEIKALLKRFPPPEWRPSRLAELKKRALILDIYPNDEESAFIDNYELWFEGYEIWRKLQEEMGKSIESGAGK